MNIKRIIEESDTPSGRFFDLTIQAFIVVSLIAFSIETLPDLTPQTQRYLRWFEVLTVSLFTFEYLARLIVADRKTHFVFSFYGLVDLLAIAPFYLAMGFDLRAVRAFRFLRLFRILKLARYNAAVRRFHRAIAIAWEELVLFGTVALIILYLAAVGIYHFENEAQPEAFKSVFHSLWWATSTLTTVGYGDVYPITIGGRLFTFAVLVVGLGVVSVPAGLIASALTQARADEDESTRR